MKTRLIFLGLLIICFSCGTNKKPVSDAQKAKINEEVKEVVNTIIKGSEEANFGISAGIWLDSPDFVYQVNGKIFNYKEFDNGVKTHFSTLKNQKCTIVDEKCAILDNSTVLYTTNCKWMTNFKDGHSILHDPWVSQLIFKKIDSKWRVYSGIESGKEQSVKNIETSKELNQIEFMKQFLGTWKAEVGKDSIMTYNARPYGNGSERDFTYSTKGKIYNSGRVLYGYDDKSDKMIEVTLYNSSPKLNFSVWWTTSKKTSEGVPLDNITNPDNAAFKMKCELKSPDIFIITQIRNNNVVGTYTFNRVKK